MSSPIIDRLDEIVADVGAKTAIIQGKKAISFQHLKESVHVYSSLLAQREIVKGDRVLIFVPMSIRLYIILLAVWRRGAVAVFVDAWTSKNRLDQVARQTDCKAFIGVPKAHLLRLFSAELRSIPQKYWELSFPKKTSRCPETATVPVDLDATALVTFTTGSTGIPKGADRTHGFLLAQNQALSEHLNLS